MACTWRRELDKKKALYRLKIKSPWDYILKTFLASANNFIESECLTDL